MSWIVAMIFLSDNVLLEKELTKEDIKPRLLGEVIPAEQSRNIYSNRMGTYNRSLGYMPRPHNCL